MHISMNMNIYVYIQKKCIYICTHTLTYSYAYINSNLHMFTYTCINICKVLEWKDEYLQAWKDSGIDALVTPSTGKPILSTYLYICT
jgi:hypothetical protein